MHHALMIPIVVWSLFLAGQEPRQEDVAKAVLNAQKANRSMLSRGKVLYRFYRGESKGEREALSGAWTDRTEAKCLLVFDGRRARLEQVYSIADLAAHTTFKGNEVSSSRSPVRVLTNGKVTLVDHQLLSEDGKTLNHQPIIEQGVEPYTREATDYIARLSRPDGGEVDFRALESALKHESGLRLESVEPATLDDGTSTLHLKVAGPGYFVEYWVDLERGGIPRRIRTEGTEDHRSILQEYRDVRAVAQGAWFPYRGVYFDRQSYSLEYLIDRADFELAPVDGEFQLEFEPPVALLDMPRGARYAPRKAWGLDHLPTVGRPDAPRITIEPEAPPPPAQAGSLKPWGWEVYLPATLGVGLIAVVVYRATRARARSSTIRG